MGCIIKYKGNIYTENDFKQYITNNKLEFTKQILNSPEAISKIRDIIKNKQTPTNTQLTNYSEYTGYSGAAKGADTVWENIGKEFGLGKQVNYRPEDLEKLTKEYLQEVENAYQKAVKDLGRSAFASDTFRGKLVRRDYLQAKAADAIFAISDIILPGEKGKPVKGVRYSNRQNKAIVDGGTGYAVQMGINLNKPVYVFHQGTNVDNSIEIGWYQWVNNQFVKVETPTLTKKFAGIGTREINENGKQAIRDVYSNLNTNKQLTELPNNNQPSNKPQVYFPLSRQKSLEGQYLTDENNQVATASVDGVKEPLDGILNINDFSSPLLNLLQKSALGLEFGIDVINTKLFRELTKSYSNNIPNTKSRKDALILSLQQMEVKYKTSILGKDMFNKPVIKPNTLKLTRSKLLKAKEENDFEVLKWAIGYFKDADELNNFILKSQTKNGLDSNITDAEKQIDDYEDVIKSTTLKTSSFKFDMDKLQLHSNYGFYEQGMKKPMDEIISKVFVDSTPFVKHVSNVALSGRTDSKLKELVKSEFLVYLFSMPDNYLGKKLMDIDVRSRLLLNNSVAKRFKEYYNQQLEKKKADVNHNLPRFINYFTTDLGIDNKFKVDKLNFMNTIARSLDSNIKSQIADEIWDLYETGNNFERQLAEDMVLYNFLMNGFNSGADSFTNFVHTKFYTEWGINTDHKSHEQILRQGLSVEDLDGFYNVSKFKDKFIKNNYKKLGEEGVIKSFLSLGKANFSLKNGYLGSDKYAIIYGNLNEIRYNPEKGNHFVELADKAIKSYFLREDEDGRQYMDSAKTMKQFKEEHKIC